MQFRTCRHDGLSSMPFIHTTALTVAAASCSCLCGLIAELRCKVSVNLLLRLPSLKSVGLCYPGNYGVGASLKLLPLAAFWKTLTGVRNKASVNP